MARIALFGNSGAGKTTLAKKLREELSLAHLDLDALAWEPSTPPKRRPLEKSAADISAFMEENASWVIEGCYADLLSLVLPRADEIIFLNPGVAACQKNCRARPWEPEKYASQEEQDKNLPMLLAWVAEYERRTDEFSLESHRRLFADFRGKKEERGDAKAGSGSPGGN